MVQASLRTKVASAGMWLLGGLLLGPTTAMAEYDVKSALQAHASADSDNRKVWELVFGNTYNGMRWANAVLVQRRQQQLFVNPMCSTALKSWKCYGSNLTRTQSLGQCHLGSAF
jgi:hypothetical protein